MRGSRAQARTTKCGTAAMPAIANCALSNCSSVCHCQAEPPQPHHRSSYAGAKCSKNSGLIRELHWSSFQSEAQARTAGGEWAARHKPTQTLPPPLLQGRINVSCPSLLPGRQKQPSASAALKAACWRWQNCFLFLLSKQHRLILATSALSLLLCVLFLQTTYHS